MDDLDRLRGKALFAHSRNAVVDIDPAGVIMAFNPAAERLLGHRARMVVGGPMRVLMPDRSVDEVAGLLAGLAGQQHVEPYATEYRRPDGEVLDLSVTAVPLARADGSAAGLSVILKDLTELHRAQADLAASEARYRTMIECAHEGIAVLDVEQRLSFVNTRMAEMSGYTVEELTGSSLDTFIFPEDERDLSEMTARRPEVRPEDAENRWRRKDGSALWALRATAPLFDEVGAFAGSVSFLTDVTDRKRAETALQASEARVRSYFDHTPVGVLLVSRESVIGNVNPALCSITGYQADELLGASLHVLLGSDHLARVEENKERFGALLSGETSSFGFERAFVTKDGRSIWLEVTISVMRDGQDDPLEFVVVIQDITSRKDAERVKDEFISVTSHELRTPLTSIRGALGLLAGGATGDLSDSARRMLDIAVQSTDRLIRLVNDILDLERLTSGTLTPSLQACDASELISRAVEEIRGVADAFDVAVRATPTDGRVWADPDRVIQTLTNLIGNAIKFSPRYGTVAVGATVDGDHVRFTVEDHGPGIPADQLEVVFERFRQVDASDSRAKGGTGLGLAICRTIVEQHGGRIWAESVLGGGSTFSFTLPVVADVAEHTVEDRRSGPAVLVGDDDRAIRHPVKTMLEARWYRMWTAASGEEALTIVRTRRPGVVVLDLVLPAICGRETANTLKDQGVTADIPVVVLTVPAANRTAVESAAPLLGKPVEEDVLVNALRHALGGNHHQALLAEDDLQLAEVLEMTLARHGMTVRRARTGREAMRLGRALVPDLVVLDVALPDEEGYSVVEWMREQRWLSTVPLLVYRALDVDEVDRDRPRLGVTTFVTNGRSPPAQFEAKLEELLDWMARWASPR